MKIIHDKKVVYTYGVFDLFHVGHLELLEEAKALGDRLIVGIFTDEVAASFKRLPIINVAHRMKVVAGCRHVDEVVIQDNLEPDQNILRLRPHILAKGPGAGWGDGARTPGEKVMHEIGGQVIKLPYHPGLSTTEIIKKIKC